MEIKELAEKFIEAQEEGVFKGNCDALDTIEAPDVVFHHMNQGQDSVGIEAHKQHTLGIWQAASNVRQEWKYLAGEGSIFALEYNGNFKFKGEMPGLASTTGKEVTSHYLVVFRLDKGKIVEVWDYGTIMGSE